MDYADKLPPSPWYIFAPPPRYIFPPPLTRPIYHSCDAAIRGHVFCSFLALVLQKELADRCRAADVTVEWDDLIRDLDRLQEATIEKDGKRVTTRTYVEGQVGRVFQAAGVALPSNWHEQPA